MDRREFCTHACRAVSLAALGGVVASALEGCATGGGPGSPDSVPALPTVSGTGANGVVTVAVDSTSPLASPGSAALVQFSGGLLLVARTSQDAFTAFNSTCTHAACTVSGFAGGTFICPCHGSRFDTSGRVVNGPAFAPLRSFATRFDGTTLSITL